MTIRMSIKHLICVGAADELETAVVKPLHKRSSPTVSLFLCYKESVTELGLKFIIQLQTLMSSEAIKIEN